MLPCSFIQAQFAVDFTTAEGYADGALGSNAGWNVYDSSGSDSNTFKVIGSDSGTMVIDPTSNGFQAAMYSGKGGTLKTNTYYAECSLKLDFKNGTTSIIADGAVVLPVFEIQNAGQPSESASFGLRQVSANGKDGNRFNIFSLNKFNGSNSGEFSNMFSGKELGLSIDRSGNWTDGQSDTLTLTFSLVHKGDNKWTETVTLANADTSKVIATASRTVSDNDGSFASNDNRLRIYPLNMATVEVAVALDKLSLAVDPE